MKQMNRFWPFVALLSLACCSESYGQCAPGIPSAGNPGCIPPDRSNSPYYQGGQTPPQAPRVVWADRWGAVAVDKSTGDAGTIEGQESEAKAQKKALSDCSSTGAQNCKVILTYHNQCAAVAFSNGGTGIARAPTSPQAEQLAMESCGGGSTCQIVYSKCSNPVQVK